MTEFAFTSARLGFRERHDDDVGPMAAIDADPAVMECFPRTVTHAGTEQFVARMRGLLAARGRCHYAVEALAEPGLLGFVGSPNRPSPATSRRPSTSAGGWPDARGAAAMRPQARDAACGTHRRSASAT